LEAVPQAIIDKSAPWDRDIQRWLWKRNLGIIHVDFKDISACLPPGYGIVGAKSPRGNWNHAIVVYSDPNGDPSYQQVHDPYPGSTEPIPQDDWVYIMFLTVLNPATGLEAS
jgi:hypothetical protein